MVEVLGARHGKPTLAKIVARMHNVQQAIEQGGNVIRENWQP